MNNTDKELIFADDEKQDQFDFDRALKGEIMAAIHSSDPRKILFRAVFIDPEEDYLHDGFFIQTWGLMNRPAFISFDDAKQRLRMTGKYPTNARDV